MDQARISRNGCNAQSLNRSMVTVLLAVSLSATPAYTKRQHTQPAAASSGAMQQFQTEFAAQAHCPSDTVV